MKPARRDEDAARGYGTCYPDVSLFFLAAKQGFHRPDDLRHTGGLPLERLDSLRLIGDHFVQLVQLVLEIGDETFQLRQSSCPVVAPGTICSDGTHVASKLRFERSPGKWTHASSGQASDADAARWSA